MKKTLYLVIITFLLIGLAVPLVAQDDYDNTPVQGEHQVRSVSGDNTPETNQPDTSYTPAPIIPVQTGATGATGARGERGSQGPRGYRGHYGPRGPRGYPGRHGRDTSSHSHTNILNAINSGDTQTLAKSNAYARVLIAGSVIRPNPKSTQEAPLASTKENGKKGSWDWLWWLLLIPIFWLLLRLLSLRGPWLRNTARFWSLGRFIGECSARVKPIEGCRQEPDKTVKNRSAGENCWRSRTQAMSGDTLRYRLRVRNAARTPVTATNVWVQDQPAEELSFIPGSAYASINTGDFCKCQVPDGMMAQFLSGRVLRMSDIPGMKDSLSANSSFYLRYDMIRVVDEVSDEDMEFVIPPTPTGSTAVIADPIPAPVSTPVTRVTVTEPAESVEEPPEVEVSADEQAELDAAAKEAVI